MKHISEIIPEAIKNKNMKIFKSAKTVKVNKPHECIHCFGNIKKGDRCTNTILSYDSHLISAYACDFCVPIKELNVQVSDTTMLNQRTKS